MKSELILSPKDRPDFLKWVVLSLQHVFAMFGATILVPLETGLDVGVALVTSGIGTLIYILFTKAKVPMYLGSSFAFIGAIVQTFNLTGNFYASFLGIISVGLVYILIAVLIKIIGTKWIYKLFPPVVIGPIIIVIGLSLAPTAISNISLNVNSFNLKVFLVSLITFVTTIILLVKAKGFLKIIPFLISILVGYLLSLILGIVDFNHFKDVSFISIPNFQVIGSYKLDFRGLLIFIPLALATISEHIGDHLVLSEIMNEDLLINPGLDKTLMGDGVATLVAGLLGGPSNTSYGENTSVVGLTKVGSVWVTGLASIIAIMLGFLGYIQAFISSIPWAVIGGITIILYGFIAGNGLKVLIKNRVDLNKSKNIIIISTMLVIGLGNAILEINKNISITGVALSAVVGIVLNLVIKD